MDFTIVTPSFRQLDWLELCIASVADQEGVTVEHIVQDAGTDGFAAFSEKIQRRWPDRGGYRRIMVSEPDRGMYDAVNKGLKGGRGRICAYLNCDEQYLPAALAKVKNTMDQNSKAQVLVGGFLVVDKQGNLVTAQRPVKMSWAHVATSHLPNFTCATFFLRSILEREQAWFDCRYRSCGDAAWMIERLKNKAAICRTQEFLGLFTETGQHLGLSAEGQREALWIRQTAPRVIRLGAPFWKLRHRMWKLLAGHYWPSRCDYALFLRGQLNHRVAFRGMRASPFWKSRFPRRKK